MSDLNGVNVDELIGVVSKKLGVPPQTLKNDLENGKFDTMLKNMKPAEEAMFNKIVNNPKALEQFMNTPQAMALYKKLTGGK